MRKEKKVKKKEKRKESRGLSSIIATLLIILISLVAIGILWIVIRNITVNQSELAKAQNEFFSENIEISKFNMNSGLVNLTLEKKGGLMIKEDRDEQTIEITEVVPVDLISVVDLSVSMSTCENISEECCATLNGLWMGSGICMGIPSSTMDACTSDCEGILLDRLGAAQNANKELVGFILSELSSSRIGLVGYNSEIVDSACINLTNDLIQLNDKINSWEVYGGTCTCCGINEAAKELQQSPKDKAKRIIIMSDGESTIGCAEQNTGDPAQDTIEAACDANESLDNLIIYTIGVGDNLDEQSLIEVANCGGGEYYPAINVDDLVDVYTHVGEDIKTTYKTISQVNYLFVVFYNGTDSYTERLSEIPDALGLKTYKFDLTGKLEGEIIKIEVYPVIITDSGKEITGPASDIWEA